MGQASPVASRPRLAAVAWRGHPRHCRTDHRAGGRIRPRLPAPGTGGPAVAGDRRRHRPPAVAGSAASPGSAASADGPGAYSSSLSIAGVSGLAQTGGACSVQRGRDLQLGVELINLSGTAVTLGQVRSILPLGGLRPDLAAVGALRRDLVVLAGNRRRLVRLHQGVDGRGRGGKLDGRPAQRHRLAQRHLPRARGVPGSAAGAVQRRLPGERSNRDRAAAGIPGPGSGHVHRMQVALTRARAKPLHLLRQRARRSPSEDQNRFARTVPCFAPAV